jgi:transcriptional regulator
MVWLIGVDPRELMTRRRLRLRFYTASVILTPVEAKGEPAVADKNERSIDEKLDLPQGTLDLLILKALSLGPQHGWAISERIHDVSRATLQIPQGSLYPALHRLERHGWIRAEWGASDNNRRAKYYELTKIGRKQLDTEAADWARLTAAVALVLRMT